MCRSSEAGVVSVVAQSTRTTFASIRERLAYFVVNKDGVLIALYNDINSAVIRLKDIAVNDYADWYSNIRPQVGLPTSSL